jgi:para-nitrobenzyl esterase
MAAFPTALWVGALLAAGCGASNRGDGTRPDGGGEDGGGIPSDDAGGEDGGACGEDTPAAPGLVVTDRGPVQGVRGDDGSTWGWLGIPYAAPPTGARRFQPPADLACREAVRVADTLPPRCPQLERPSPEAELVRVGDEDCLALNVWAPTEPPGPSLPVLVFIHGGGNTIGSTSQRVDGELLYDGARLAGPLGVVVVTLQYRLGPLGFLAQRALSQESERGVSGNYGILDQQAALRWVQRNIDRFGGDPGRVLVFGESAGAVDTCVHLASPESAGLFAAALMQSGSCAQPPLARREEEGDDYVQAAGCADAADLPACLRALTVDEALFALPAEVSVVAAGNNLWGPNVDGWVLPEPPLDAMAAGRSAPVPFVVGSNTDETGRDAPVIADTDDAYLAALRGLGIGNLGASLITDEYPREAYGSARAAFVQATTDASFTCSARRAARAQAEGHPELPVHRYLFGQRLLGGSALLRAFGAWHGLELLFLFDRIEVGGYEPTVGDRTVANALRARWVAFADDGDPDPPSSDGDPSWPRYAEPAEPMLLLGPDSVDVAASDPRGDKCDFWDGLAAAAGPGGREGR